MFRWFWKRLRFLGSKRDTEPKEPSISISGLSGNLELDQRSLEERLGSSPDLIARRFIVGANQPVEAMIVFAEGLIDKAVIQDHILRPLMSSSQNEKNGLNIGGIGWIKEHLLTISDLKEQQKIDDLVDAVLGGDTVLLIEGNTNALTLNTRGWEKRGIQEPDTEVIIKGPREGFVETMGTNTAMLRRKLGHPSLTFYAMRIGRKSKTDVSIAYLKGIANDKIVEEVKKRLERIDTDGILAAGFVEQYIEDAPYSPFSTVGYSERPDVVAAKLLEGRIAIFINGTPVVNTVPMLFVESFQSPDDYNFRPFYATIIRWFRYIAYSLSVILPAFYVALTTFHQELIPTELLLTMAAAMEGAPFPAVFEALGMGFIFEVLREAGIRLPRPIGQAVSIVGALVIGEATVAAGLVGAPVVIVVAFTAIASFVVPTQTEVGAILRFSLTVLAGVLGAYGIIGGVLLILVHMVALRSFGVPYLSPIAPLTLIDLKDVLIRAPIWAMFSRPRVIGWQNPVRQKLRIRPELPPGGKESDEIE